MTKPKESLLPPVWVLVLLCVAGLVWILSELREIVVLLVVGYCIAYVMDPALTYLERKRISRGVGFFVLCGTALIVILILGVTALPTIAREYENLSQNLPRYIDTAKEKAGPIFDELARYVPLAGERGRTPIELVQKIKGDTLNKILVGIGSTLLGGYNLTLTLINLLLLPFIVYYFAIDFHLLHRGALFLFPPQNRKRVASICSEIDSSVAAFLSAQITVACVLFFLYAVGLGFIGVELWLLLAVIASFGNMIPYLGFLVGIILSSVMALVTFADLAHLLQVWGLFILVQFLEGSFISPRLLGERVGISPLVVILAIFAGGQLFGLLGILLAVPGAAVVKVLGNHLHRWLMKSVA